jgi:hypothetical protein
MWSDDSGGRGQAKSTITARGRFVALDDGLRQVGIKGAKVVMYDNDFFFPCVPTFGACRQFMGASYTDDDGTSRSSDQATIYLVTVRIRT